MATITWANFRATAAGTASALGNLSTLETTAGNMAYFITNEPYPKTRNNIVAGYVGTAGFGQDVSTAPVVQLGGWVRIWNGSTGSSQAARRRQVISGQAIKLHLALFNTGGGGTMACCIWDGAVDDPANGATEGTVLLNTIKYAGATGVTVGKYLIANGKLYRCTAVTGTGTVSGTAPSHASGSAVDGEVTWTFIKAALLLISGTGNPYMDARGNPLTAAAWAANEIPSLDITPTGGTTLGNLGYITLTRTSLTGDNLALASWGIEPAALPLEPTRCLDEEAVDVGQTPTVYANQPAGKLLCRLTYIVGNAATTSYEVVGGTLGGDATDYFEAVFDHPDRPGEWWLRHTGNRLPDSTAVALAADRTIIVRQTETDPTFGGSPKDTELICNVISSQSRPTAVTDGVWAQISTECWLRYKTKAKDRSDTYWNGVPSNATFPNGDYVVTSPADLKAKIESLPVGLGQKYRIQLQDLGTNAWFGGAVLSSVVKDFLTAGGYLVIEPAAVGPATLRGRWFVQNMRGIEIRNTQHPGRAAADGQDELNISISSNNPIVILRNINFLDPDWSQDDTWNDTKTFVDINGAECVRVLNCKMTGGKRNIYAEDCRLLEVAYNDVGQTVDDFCDLTMTGKKMGVWADDDQVIWLHHNRVNNLMDKVTGLHLDFSQYSKTFSYPTGNVDRGSNYPATTISSGEARLILGRFYRAVQAGDGVTEFHADNTTLPTHESGTAFDGTVEWQYISDLPHMPKIWVVCHHNVMISGGIVSKFKASTGTYEHPGAQFLINSNSGAPWPIACFNNGIATNQQRGVNMEAANQIERNYIEFNSFVGPHEHPVAAGTVDFVEQWIKTLGPAGKVRAYKNICMGVDPNVFSEGNIVAKGKNPPAGKAYWDFTRAPQAFYDPQSDGVQRFPMRDDGLDAIEDTMSAFSKIFHANGGRAGARFDEKWPFTVQVRNKVTGALSNEISGTIRVANP